jgi:hypothetical protein
MDKTRLGWVVFSYVTLGGVYLLLGYLAPALDQTLTTTVNLTFLFSSVFLAFQGYRAISTDGKMKPNAEAPLPMATCRCGRRYVKTHAKQSQCTSCFFLDSTARAFPRRY